MSREVSRRTTRGRKSVPNNAAPNKAATDKANRKKAAAPNSSASTSSREKVRAFRQRMRLKGLRLVQMWVPDTRTVKFAAEARRQSRLANRSKFAAEDQTWADALSDWNSD